MEFPSGKILKGTLLPDGLFDRVAFKSAAETNAAARYQQVSISKGNMPDLPNGKKRIRMNIIVFDNWKNGIVITEVFCFACNSQIPDLLHCHVAELNYTVGLYTTTQMQEGMEMEADTIVEADTIAFVWHVC